MRQAWVLIVLLIGLGVWLVYSPVKTPPKRPGASSVELKVGRTKGVVEVWHPPVPGSTPEFRVLLRDGFQSQPMSADEFRRVFGAQALSNAISSTTNWAFQLFNITSWWSLLWVGIGLGGQAAFSGRTLVQWVKSEKEGRSVVPPSFWWMSLIGGIALFAYFVWRQDPVGVLGQAPGVVIYSRNLRLIYLERKRVHPDSP